MAKFETFANAAILSLNLVQVTESISGSVVSLAMFSLLTGEDNTILTSFGPDVHKGRRGFPHIHKRFNSKQCMNVKIVYNNMYIVHT